MELKTGGGCGSGGGTCGCASSSTETFHPTTPAIQARREENLTSPAPAPRTEAEMEVYKLHRRFDRFGRLIGDEKMATLMKSHVMVIGLGGVGSWAAESLIRSGVGQLTIVDFDEICITNTNRQLHAMSGMVGKRKAEVLAERFSKINPHAKIKPIVKFYNPDHQAEIFSVRPDFVIDAIDNVTAKCHLLAFCRDQKIPVVCSTGSGGRMDPTQVRMADLSVTESDPLARSVRKILRQKYGYPEKGFFGIPAVFSVEPPTDPVELHYDGGKGFTCVCPQGENPYHTCENRNIIMGSAAFVTGTFGFTCASVAIRHLLDQ